MVAAMLYAADVENAALVIEVCSALSSSDTNTVRALAEECNLTQFQAEAILDIQLRRISPASIARMRSDLNEIEGSLEQIDPDSFRTWTRNPKVAITMRDTPGAATHETGIPPILLHA